MKTDYQIKKVVIAGGGTAGWMTAAALSKLLGKNLDITLVESDLIPPVGVGEATIPTLQTFHRLLGINEHEFLAACQGTYKLGINFENWRDVNKDYLHAFGVTGKDCWGCGFQHFWVKGKSLGLTSDYGDYCLEKKAAEAERFAPLANNGLNYAYHIDAGLYAKFLRRFAEKHGISRIEGKITSVDKHDDNGFIKSISLDKGQCIEADFFIDCTGMRALLIEGALHTGYEDWSHWLPCDSAIAVQTESVEAAIPYTRSIAHDWGWQWKIPLQHRTGNGVVYSSKFVSDDEAKERLLSNIQGKLLTEPRIIKYRTGRRLQQWHKNCLAIGLSSGFLEPLESTSIHLIQQNIVRFLRFFPSDGVKACDIKEFNYQANWDIEKIRDFIVLHYKVTDRRDTPFWKHCSSMAVSESLQHRIDLFQQTGKVFREGNELFDDSWQQVMIGQGIVPDAYHPIVDNMSKEELKYTLDAIKSNINAQVVKLPKHAEYVEKMLKR